MAPNILAFPLIFRYTIYGTSKTVNGTKHTYYYAGGKLLRETYGSNILDFFYDANGHPYALKHNGTIYYYITNLQGDVMSIVDGSGAVKATYNYDPYGNVITATGTMAEVNPLRYRGYYYDTETGFYYLQSRYYDPGLGRFLNADAFASTGQGILGNNMFAYCGNNPIIYSDPTGTKRKIWFQLFEDHDPGYIHRAVQVHILATYNAKAAIYSSEHYMPGIGKADIVCLDTNEMWEIKHGGSTDDARTAGINNADAQLNRYILKGAPFQKGRVDAFSGIFVISVNSINYVIEYSTPQQGVILYYILLANSPERKPNYVYVPHTLYKEQHALAGVIAFAFVGGGISPFPQQEALLGT